jgi:hypothetical protein
MAYINKGALAEILSKMSGGAVCLQEAMTGQELSRMIMRHLASCGEEAAASRAVPAIVGAQASHAS